MRPQQQAIRLGFEVECVLRKRMQASNSASSARQCEIRWLFRQGGFQFQIGAALFHRSLQLCLGNVDKLSDGWPFLLWKGAKLFHEGGKFSVRTKVLDLRLFQRSEISRRVHFVQRGTLERLDVFDQVHTSK